LAGTVLSFYFNGTSYVNGKLFSLVLFVASSLLQTGALQAELKFHYMVLSFAAKMCFLSQTQGMPDVSLFSAANRCIESQTRKMPDVSLLSAANRCIDSQSQVLPNVHLFSAANRCSGKPNPRTT
jgi:hypothetical protein